MKERGFIFVVVFVTLACSDFARGEDKRGFLATFPTSVVPGGDAQFCIRFFNVNEDVVIHLEDNEPRTFDAVHQTIPSTKETCVRVKINKVSSEERKFLTLSGETLDGTYKFNNTKMFTVKQISELTFVETDKPVYKPGQKVQIRLLTLDHQLNPLDKVYQEVFVQDSSNTRIFQWLNVQSNTGLVKLEVPISEEPNFGDWKITVNENINKEPVAVASFVVKKYVLPKFELQFDTPTVMVTNQKELSFTACAKYSYGKNVKGQLELEVFARSYRTMYSDMSTLKHTQKLRGCETITLSADKILTENYIYNLEIKGTFKEDDTDIKVNAEKKIEVSNRQFKLDLVEPKYYKPGLPTKMRIRIQTPENKAVVGRKIGVKISQSGVGIFNQDYISDESGFITVFFSSQSCEDDKNCNKKAVQLYIEASPEEELNNTKLTSSFTGFSIQPWHSKKNAYLQIYKPDGLNAVKCGDDVKLYLKLRLNKRVEGKIHFQVQGRSSVVYAGSFNVDTNELSVDVGRSSGEVMFSRLNRNQKRSFYIERRISICDMAMSEGEGDEAEHQWYFDEAQNKCFEFTFKGKGGTLNRFLSEKTCMDMCRKSEPQKVNFQNEHELDEDPAIVTFALSFKAISDLAPEMKLLAFYVTEGEVIPDSVSIPVGKCLRNRVALSLNADSVTTGSEVKVRVSGAPRSLCALSAIDKSVTFMGKRNSIDLEGVFERLSSFKLDQDWYNHYPETEACEYNRIQVGGPKPIRIPVKRSYIYPGYGRSTYDAVEAFKESSVVVFTDLLIEKQCQDYFEYEFDDDVSSIASGMPGEPGPVMMEMNIDTPQAVPMNVADLKPTVTNVVREFFPETWLWDIETLSQDGSLELTKRAPDSITDWIFNAYCLSKEHSIGIATPAILNVFQPFFVSVNLPYSVVRGEILPAQASVFNYMSKCIPVLIQFVSESRISLTNELLGSVKKCVCPDDKVSHVFQARALDFNTEVGVNVTIKVTALQETNVCPESAGEIANLYYSDSETRQVLVEPEGISNEIVKSVFVLLSGNSTEEEYDIALPQYIVQRSARAYLTVIGDPMGPAMNNLDRLVELPTGCGEQNMVRFAPLVSVTKYLTYTSQLNQKVAKLAEEYLKIGYQRQLTYRHDDGSYSAFGKSDKLGGGTWLTAFVLRCLSQSFGVEQVKVDQKDIEISFNWLLKTQAKDGSFPSTGTALFSKGLAGGMGDNKKIGLSAYVVISLLTSISNTNMTNYDQDKVKRGVLFLKQSVFNFETIDTYTLALSLYAFKLANEHKAVIIEVENELDKRATVKDGLKYWKQTEDEPQKEKQPFYYYKPQSADIEITSYIVLAKLHNFDKTQASSIVPIIKWLNSQRNSLGGFYSTQDTVVALDALSRFAGEFYSKRVNLRVGYTYNSQPAKPILIGQHNRLLLNKLRLLPFHENKTNSLKLSVSGTGSGLVQFSVRYNTKREVKTERSFDLKIQAAKKADCKSVTIDVKTNYTGADYISSMAIVNLRLPSGWAPLHETITQLTNDQNVKLKRHEINENRVVLYFDEITKLGKNFRFEIVKNFDVKNTKPGVVSVYDYYESQDDSLNQEFTLPCP